MTNITNYDYHVQKMGGGTGSALPGMFQFSQLNSSSIQARLKAAGIDTGSRQYKAVIRQMAKDGCTGSMFTCVQAIKNLMKNYNARGEWVEPTTGLTGLLVTDETGDSYKRMIDIPENSKEKMFEYVKNNYIEKNGMADGAGKTEIYMEMYKQMDRDERLSAGWTLGEYRKAYSQAFVSAIKEVDPAWTYGKAIPSDVLEGITREFVEVNLKKPDSSLARASLNIQI